MEEENTAPMLLSVKPIKSEHKNLQKILITSKTFNLGRALLNNVVIPIVTISRNHCKFHETEKNEWLLEDTSSFGIKINNEKMAKGVLKRLFDGDIITLEPTEEFVYKFIRPDSDDFEIPMKRIKLEKNDNIILDDVKKKFEQSQKNELTLCEEKLQSAKQLQANYTLMKRQVQLDMDRKIQQLKNDYAKQIENLQGEKIEVERQKKCLLEERDVHLTAVQDEMEGKIKELMEQIQKHNETESELLKENNSLKEKLTKEREEFLSELSRESSSKQDMLDQLETKIREQEEVRLKEKQELEETLKRETEILRLAKEKEVKELEEQKRQRELELQQELDNIRKNLAEQMEQTEQQKLIAEQKLNEQMEQMKKLSDEEKIKMEQLQKDREEIQNQLKEAQENAEKSKTELQKRVMDRETELAALAAERIQQQAEQSSEVINTLQEQLEKVKSQLQCVETEKNSILESICYDGSGEGTSKQTTLTEVGELMESELQCSICAELFIEAMTLNCSHTFCKYCITMWKKKKKDCPICRSSITSENRSLVLDTFIDKMVQNLTQEMKTKRQDILKFRADWEEGKEKYGRRSFNFDESEISDELGEEEEEEYYDEDEYAGEDDYEVLDFFDYRGRYRYRPSDTDSGSDESTDTDGSGGAAAAAAAAGVAAAADAAVSSATSASSVSNTTGWTSVTTTADSATHRPIPTIDLTMLPIPMGLAERPAMLLMLLPLPRYYIPPPAQLVYQILQMGMGQAVMVVAGGAVPSRAYQVPTTAATGGASLAAPAATGPPAARSDNQMPFPFIPIDSVPLTRN